MFYSQATQEDTANQFEVHIGGYNGGYTPGLNITNPVINSNGTFTGGVASGVYPLVRGMYNKREDEINAVGWNNQFSVGEAAVVADISWSKAERDELSLENNTQLPAGAAAGHGHLRLQRRATSRPSTRAWITPIPAQPVPRRHHLRLGLRQDPDRGR